MSINGTATNWTSQPFTYSPVNAQVLVAGVTNFTAFAVSQIVPPNLSVQSSTNLLLPSNSRLSQIARRFWNALTDLVNWTPLVYQHAELAPLARHLAGYEYPGRTGVLPRAVDRSMSASGNINPRAMFRSGVAHGGANGIRALLFALTLPLGEGTAMFAFLLLSTVCSNPAASIYFESGAYRAQRERAGVREKNYREPTTTTYLKQL